MLGLPKATELSKQLPKKAIYAKFGMNTAAKEKFDKDISKIVIVNEVSPSTTSIAEGEEVKAFYVLHILLKNKDFDEKTIQQITKLIPQNLLLLLEYEEKSKLAVYRTKLLQSEWKPSEELSVQIKGLDLDAVWENIVVQIGNVEIEEGNTLDEQIAVDEKRAKIKKEIKTIENKIRKEKQLNVQMKLNSDLKKLKKELEEL